MLKVLVSAHACSPHTGGESGISWNLVSRLANYHEIWVITQGHSRREIQNYLEEHPNPNFHFVYYDIPWLVTFASWFSNSFLLRPYIFNLYYYLWQLAIYSVIKRLDQEQNFDLTHHISYSRYWMPSLLSLLPAPFVWGTVGGADVTPASLIKTLSIRGRFFEIVRVVMLKLAEFDPLVRLTARRSAIALANTPATSSRLHSLGARNIIQSFDCGFDIDGKIPTTRETIPGEATRLRLLSVGRLIHWKGYHLSLQAFAQCNDLQIEYWLYGQGIERKKLEDLCHALKIQDQVHFIGHVPYTQILDAYSESDIFVHPSLHETGGWSVLEAMASSLPVICLDLGGPAVSVSDQTGIKIPAHSSQQVIDDLASAIRRLTLETTLRKQMGAAARERVKDHFSWDAKTRQLLKIYKQVTLYQKDNRSANPPFYSSL